MKIETLLPLGKVDPGLRAAEQLLDIDNVGADAQLVESLGYDRLVVEETKDDPFVIMALAAAATRTLGLGTSVAIAFPRSPALAAMSAWTLQKQSRGRFCLGLGPQVRGHIQRRYGLKWSPPGPWMRDYIGAVRAIWTCWQNGTPLAYQSEHYNLNLMVPLFDPGPIEDPEIPIVVAAVGPKMCEAGGEVADGIRPHPVCTPKYIEEVMLPAVHAGAGRSGRVLDGFEIAMKPLIATAADEETLAARVRDARARIAFYCSTPAYRPAFEIHGLGDLARELAVLSKAGRWDEMPERISDDILHEYVTVGTYEEIGDRLVERFGNVVNSVEFSIAVGNDSDRETLASLIERVHSAVARAA
jgi:probable F420-dependent oxidoreductase